MRRSLEHGVRQQGTELLSLSTAAAIVYQNIMGSAIEPADVAKTDAILHGVAHAISNVAPIYGIHAENGGLKPLPALDLMHEAFQRGATVLRTHSGIEYRNLCIQRRDMMMEITILMRASAKFAVGDTGVGEPPR